jgi:hypothetical protein
MSGYLDRLVGMSGLVHDASSERPPLTAIATDPGGAEFFEQVEYVDANAAETPGNPSATEETASDLTARPEMQEVETDALPSVTPPLAAIPGRPDTDEPALERPSALEDDPVSAPSPDLRSAADLPTRVRADAVDQPRKPGSVQLPTEVDPLPEPTVQRAPMPPASRSMPRTTIAANDPRPSRESAPVPPRDQPSQIRVDSPPLPEVPGETAYLPTTDSEDHPPTESRQTRAWTQPAAKAVEAPGTEMPRVTVSIGSLSVLIESPPEPPLVVRPQPRRKAVPDRDERAHMSLDRYYLA